MYVVYPKSLIEKKVNVRKAIKGDAQKIAQLYGESFSEHIMVQRGLLNDKTYIENRLDNADEDWVVAEFDGDVAGVAALAKIKPVGLAEIERVCVDKRYRGNSLAYNMCKHLVDAAVEDNMGFVEAYARGDQPAMQKTFYNLGFKVYGVSPRFEVVHDEKVVREQFVHMGLELKPESIDMTQMRLIPKAKNLFDIINSQT
ncbi:GNAT family N-acetyltransferase [Candidatus Woesearchaeota archaeon]|nr:MAG: GNAT family N-acetyltransferase [Candidatus Woesearchaeota archaeon]